MAAGSTFLFVAYNPSTAFLLEHLIIPHHIESDDWAFEITHGKSLPWTPLPSKSPEL
jgi:hypothetical protein